MNGTVITQQVRHFEGIKIITISLSIILIILSCLWYRLPDRNIAYKSYWIEIKTADLDKPATITHVAVLRYYLRKTHSDDLERELNSQPQITNRQLIMYLNEVASIYKEYQMARQPRRGALNPS